MILVPETELLAVAAEALQVEVGALSAQTSRGSLPQWDSLGHVMLLLAVEGHFQVKFSLEQMEGFKTLRQIHQALSPG